MNVRAKFRVDEVVGGAWGPPSNLTKYWKIKMSPVCRDSSDPYDENTEFWEATPSGELVMDIQNEVAAKAFTPGQEFYVDFSPVPIKE